MDGYFFLYIGVILITFLGGMALIEYSMTRFKEIYIPQTQASEEPNIIWYQKCDGYVQPYYQCQGIRFENLTGLYCDGVLVCQKNYKIAGSDALSVADLPKESSKVLMSNNAHRTYDEYCYRKEDIEVFFDKCIRR